MMDQKYKDWIDANVPTYGDAYGKCRVVTEAEARTLSWTANLSRNDFTPCEEAKVFKSMLDSGMSLEDTARATHRSASYVRSALPLNSLCHDIRVMIGQPCEAGGIDKYIAFALAERCQRYRIAPAQQQELWHRVLKHLNLTPKFVRGLLDKIAGELEPETTGLLFDLPPSIEQAVKGFRDRAHQLRRAQLGIEYLMVCVGSGVLDEFPALKLVVDRQGRRILDGIKARVQSDAEVIGELCCA